MLFIYRSHLLELSKLCLIAATNTSAHTENSITGYLNTKDRYSGWGLPRSRSCAQGVRHDRRHDKTHSMQAKTLS